MTLEDILARASDATLAKAILKSYSEIEDNYVLENWKYSQLDAGHFVEAVRRFIELKLFSAYTRLGSPLPNFNDSELKRYESVVGDDSYRIIIPRVLFAIYVMRNKRGAGHLGGLPANEMDASIVLHASKWVLAELARLSSILSASETMQMVSRIIERPIQVLWKEGDIVTVLDPSMSTRHQVLVHLLDTSPQTEVQLRTKTEYKNSTNFGKILRRLHKDRLVHLDRTTCHLTPSGRKEAEKIVLAWRAAQLEAKP